MEGLLEEGMPYYSVADDVREALTMFAMTERWHWTPSQIRGLEDGDFMMYRSLLSGVCEGEKNKG